MSIHQFEIFSDDLLKLIEFLACFAVSVTWILTADCVQRILDECSSA